MAITRKDFLHSVAGFGAGIVGVSVLTSCSDGEPGGEEYEDEEQFIGACSPNAAISANHGHSVIVFGSHVNAGTERQYSIQGSSTHRHFITVTSSMFAQLAAGQVVSVVSGGVSHTHTVTLACVPICNRGVTISANHGHSLVVPFTHVAYGTERQYSIQGTSAHRHFITVTPAMFAMLRAGMPVSVESGGVSHRHTVTITCPAPMPSCSPSATFSANHGHVLAVSGADVAAGVEMSYNVAGSSGHLHTVVVTEAMFSQLAAGMTVQTSATGGNHSHTVTINCPSSLDGLFGGYR